MDTEIHNLLLSNLSIFKTDAIGVFNEVIPLALAFIITFVVTLMAIKWFMRIAGLNTVAGYNYPDALHTDIHSLTDYIVENDPEFWGEIEADVENSEDS